MSNFERGDRALEAIRSQYEDPTGTIGNKVPTPDGGEVVAFEGYPISDMLADTMHLIRRLELDIPTLLREAWEHYGADVVEQAWEHSDDWHDELQHESNQARAVAVLRTAGVPIDLDYAVMVKVGMVKPDA